MIHMKAAGEMSYEAFTTENPATDAAPAPKQIRPAPDRRTKETKIWAVGGGKGGIGKSFIISSVAQCLARRGHRIVLLDADLGGANLHTFFGVDRPRTTLTEFFERQIPLSSLVCETGVPNLGLLIGALDTLAADHIRYTQKMKLFRHIRTLPVDYVLIDIGAGTHFHTVDSFLLADTLIAAVVPELISVENLYYFLKSVFYRKLLRAMSENGWKTIIFETWKNRRTLGIRNVKELTDYLRTQSGEISDVIDETLSGFLFHIVVNKVRRRQEIKVGLGVKSICMKYFGLDARYAGYIEHDELVSRSINKRQPYMQTHIGSRCSGQIEVVAENLLQQKAFR